MPAATGAGGVPPLNVSIRITTTGARAAASAMGTVTKASGGMTRGLTTGVISARTLGDAMRMSASLMKYTVAGAFMKVGTAAVQAARNFELSFSRIRGLTGMAADAVEKMKTGVLEMATETTRGPEELAEALYFVTSSGLRDANVAMDVLKVSAKASAAGLGETKTVVDAVTSAMNAYGPANLSAARATDVLVATVREGKAEADTFAPAFSKVLPVAAAFGASFEDVAAAMAALTRSGMTAGTAGIYVRQVLSQLLKPSKQASDMLTQVGTSAEQIRANIRDKGMFVALQELSTRLGGIDKGAPAFAKVFGNVRALTAMLQLVGPAAAENAEIFERLQNSAGDLSDAFTAYEDTIDAKFNKALAASRVALIEIGDAIKPVVTTILQIATVFAKLAKVILDNPVAKGLLNVVGGATLLVAAMAGAMKTTSALIRLLANLTITLSGNQIMYNANTKALYRLSTATTTTAASTATLTHAGKTYTKMSFSMAGGIKKVAMALKTMVAANKVMLAVILAIAAAGAIWKFLDKANKKAKEVSEGVSKITDVLDEAVKFGKTTFAIDVGANLDDQETRDAVDRIGEQIDEMSPGFVQKVNQVFERAGQESGIQYLNALMNSVFGGMTEDTKSKLLAYFMDEFNIKDEEWAKALGFENVSGDAVTDAFLQSAVLAASGAQEVFADALTARGGIDFTTMFDQIAEETQAGYNKLEPDSSKTRKAMAEYGNAIVDGLQQTEGSLQPFLLTVQKLDEVGALTSQNLEIMFGDALHQLSGDLNIAKEKSADFYEIFKHGDNKAALTKMIMQTTGLGSAAAAVKYQQIRNDIMQMSKTTPVLEQSAAAAKILATQLEGSLEISEDVVTVNEDVADSYQLLRDEVNGAIESYNQQKNTMKQLKDAQRSLLGLNLDQEESLRAVLDAMNDVRDATKDGGGFNMYSEAGRKNREELQKAAEAATEYANVIFTETGDYELAGRKFQEGLMGIIAASSDQGAAQQALEEMGFTPAWFAKSLLAGEEEVTDQSVNIGKNVMSGVSQGVMANSAGVSATVVQALRNVIISAEKDLGIKSPSRETAKRLGIPMAQGIGAGFSKEMRNQSGGMAKDLNTTILKLYSKGGNQKTIQKFFKDFLDKKKNVETPAQDFVKSTIGRMKDIIGSLGNYIKSQLSFRDAQSNLAKLINMQRGLDDRRKRAAREVQYSETRFGGDGGAQVTGYEQAQIDQAQFEFERVSRDYAMGRASYIELVDAEIALNEARESAAEVNDDVINAQNGFIDATVNLENRSLELAAAQVDVLEAYQDVQEASYELYINHKELEQVYTSLAAATGLAYGKIMVGSKDMSTLGGDVNNLSGYVSTVGGYISTVGNDVDQTGIKFNNNFYGEGGIFGTIQKTGSTVQGLTSSIRANFTNLSRGLLDTNSEMYQNLKSLGPSIFNAIQTAANEQFAKSPLHLVIPVNVTTTGSGGGGKSTTTDNNPYSDDIKAQYESAKSRVLNAYRSSLSGSQYRGAEVARMMAAYEGSAFFRSQVAGILSQKGFDIRKIQDVMGRAVGGPVSAMNPYIVGERGPEMFVPKVSGTIVTASALERYSRVRERSQASQGQGTGNNIVVTVNNPTPAAAEESITRRMKVLANSGLFG